MLLLLAACQTPSAVDPGVVEVIAGPAASPVDDDVPAGPPLPVYDRTPVAPAPAPVAPVLAPQADPPAGTLRSRLAWLEKHAPLDVPTTGCAWMPPAPGCGRPAWVCVAPFDHPGGGGGSRGADVVFGVDAEAMAETAATVQVNAFDDSEASPLVGDLSAAGALRLEETDEVYGFSIYNPCIRGFEDEHPCPGCSTEAWPGHAKAEARCEAEADKATETETDATLVLVDACTGFVGLHDDRGYRTVPVPWVTTAD